MSKRCSDILHYIDMLRVVQYYLSVIMYQGADLVIGSHPHVVQETETYKGKQLAYSLGNLVFGGNQNPSDKNGLIFQQTMIFDINTRTIVSETHSAVLYLVSSANDRNDYHPVRSTSN